jgi:Fe-S cluster assembly protein SufD
MVATTVQKDILTQLKEAFGAREKDAHPARQKAMELLLQKGLPTAKSEEYRFTPVVRTLETNFKAAQASAPALSGDLQLIPGLEANLIVFLNGQYDAAYSRIIDNNLTVQRAVPTPAADQDPFDLLNQAFGEDTVEIIVPEHQHVKHPVVVVYYFSHPSFVFANPRWSLKIGTGSTCTLIEHTSTKPGTAYFNNKQTRLEVKDNARLDYVAIQHGGREEVQVNNTTIWLSTAAQVLCYTCTLSGKLVRNNLTLVLDGEGIDAHLHGLYLVSGSSVFDNHTVVDHRKPNSFSNQLYKGVMDEQGKAVFNGKIFVRPDAQKTNAFQSNRNILLSETSTIHTKPQLEIWADDVKCSHGCTTGQLDEEALFYLRSRGIPKDAARGLLLTAFAGETLDGIHDETIRAFVEGLILEHLHPAQP